MVAPLFWSVALLGLSAWGVGTSAYGRRRASDISWPWRVLLMVLAGRVLCWLVQGVLSWWQLPLLVQVSQTSVGVFLFLGLMADRVDTRWGQPVVVLTGGVLVVLATLWYLFTNYFWQQADARALLMLQILPLLLLPSGLLNLPVRLLRNREIRFMVLAYALTLIASWSLLPATGSALRWVDALYQALPWGSLLALCLLLLSPVVRARRAQGQRTARGAHQSAD